MYYNIRNKQNYIINAQIIHIYYTKNLIKIVVINVFEYYYLSDKLMVTFKFIELYIL